MSEKLCVVMPVYNEQDAIGPVLEKWAKALDALGIDYTIRPYNDGSRDDSLAVMKAAAAHLPRVDVRDKKNGGHGNTILTGYRDAAADGFDWVFQIDSDDEMGPEKFGELWVKRRDYDFLVGIRDGRVQQLPRKVISFVSRLCVRFFYGKSVWDVNTPYRLMRVSAFKDFYAAIPLTTFAPNVILSGLAARSRLHCYEIRVPQHDRTTGEVSIKKWKLLKAAAKSFGQTVLFSFSSASSHRRVVGCLLLLFFLVSVCKALLAIWIGPQGDTRSFALVARTILDGGSAYTTGRYNYGPVWCYVVTFFHMVFGDGMQVAIVLVMILADGWIALMLWGKDKVAAVLFLLCPLCIYISGTGRMFDNVAIAIALFGILRWGESRTDKDLARVFCLAMTIGFSLILKHDCAFLPLWLAFHERKLIGKSLVLCLPVAMFGCSFLFPILGEFHAIGFAKSIQEIFEVWSHGSLQEVLVLIKDSFPVTGGIIRWVFQYQPGGRAYFWEFLLPGSTNLASAKTLFVIAMIVCSVFARRLSAFHLFCVYLCAMFAFAPGLYTYYWMIPLLSVAVSPMALYVLYTCFGLITMWYRFPMLGNGEAIIKCPHLIGSSSQLVCVVIALVAIGWFLRKGERSNA